MISFPYELADHIIGNDIKRVPRCLLSCFILQPLVPLHKTSTPAQVITNLPGRVYFRLTTPRDSGSNEHNLPANGDWYVVSIFAQVEDIGQFGDRAWSSAARHR
jgi:hypothetical protein